MPESTYRWKLQAFALWTPPGVSCATRLVFRFPETTDLAQSPDKAIAARIILIGTLYPVLAACEQLLKQIEHDDGFAGLCPSSLRN
jgi:hypothetical protein